MLLLGPAMQQRVNEIGDLYIIFEFPIYVFIIFHTVLHFIILCL